MAATTTSDRIIQALTAISLLVTPVLVAVIGFRATSSSTEKDYVALAVSILNAKDSPKESREWATTVLNKLSPVPVPDTLKQQLGSGEGLSASPVQYIPSPPMDCPSKKAFVDWQAARPKRPPYARTHEELDKNVALYAARLEVYADYSGKILSLCSHLSDEWKKEGGTSSQVNAPGSPTRK